MFYAAILSMTGIFFMRYNLVVAGQVVPLEVIDQSPLPVSYLTYSPSWVELAIVCLGFGFVGLAYLMAEKRLNLGQADLIHRTDDKFNAAQEAPSAR